MSSNSLNDVTSIITLPLDLTVPSVSIRPDNIPLKYSELPNIGKVFAEAPLPIRERTE